MPIGQLQWCKPTMLKPLVQGNSRKSGTGLVLWSPASYPLFVWPLGKKSLLTPTSTLGNWGREIPELQDILAASQGHGNGGSNPRSLHKSHQEALNYPENVGGWEPKAWLVPREGPWEEMRARPAGVSPPMGRVGVLTPNLIQQTMGSS